MNQMVERVAIALFVSSTACVDGTAEEWLSSDDEMKDRFHCHARAAIKAMREPTSAMTKAGAESTHEPFVAYTAWHWMVDEALKDG